jgi:hypothetical protein
VFYGNQYGLTIPLFDHYGVRTSQVPKLTQVLRAKRNSASHVRLAASCTWTGTPLRRTSSVVGGVSTSAVPERGRGAAVP